MDKRGYNYHQKIGVYSSTSVCVSVQNNVKTLHFPVTLKLIYLQGMKEYLINAHVLVPKVICKG